jgi:hypothetical protein
MRELSEMALRPLTPTRFRLGHDHASPEALLERAQALAGERQELRARGASSAALELNRLDIARTHWRLAHALLERHRPQS